MKLSSLLLNLSEKEVFNFNDCEIENITDNSQDVQPGSLFVARQGQRTNGHSFIEEAKAKGAIAFVVEDKRYIKDGCFICVPSSSKALSILASSFFQNPSQALEIIGVTGTNGKTTTVFLIEKILNFYFPTASFSTIGQRIGDCNFPTLFTTPPPLEIHRLLHIAKNKGIRFVVMEVSSHSLSLDRVFGIRFSKAIWTNLTEDHLDFHKTLDNYFNAKKSLFLSLDKDCEAFVNIDDPFYKRLIDGIKAKVITYGIENHADFKGYDIEEKDGISFSIKGERIKTSLFGRYNVYNCLAAISAARSYGIPFDAIKEAIFAFKPPPGRFEVIFQNPKIVIDYAHTPDALYNALKASWATRPKRVILVFGCGGNREREKRPIMGNIASNEASLIIVTSDNPRDEDPEDIIREIELGLKKDYIKIPDRRSAIAEAIKCAEPDDLVLIAGRGHEEYQIIGGKRIPFSDKKVALEILKELGKN